MRNDATSKGGVVNNHELPPEPQVPDEDPPPYTPTAEPGTTTLDANVAPYHRPPLTTQRPPQPPRPQQVTPPQQPPRPVSTDSKQRPSSGNGSSSSYSGRPHQSGSSSYRPPPPPPGQYPGQRYSSVPPPSQYQRPQQLPPPGRLNQGPSPPFQYPRGYWCPKCHNTSVKLKNGLPCQDCYARFARQSNNVVSVPPAPMLGPMRSFVPGIWGPTSLYAGPGRVVRPGDPAIGGILCGHCRGRGMINDLFFEDTCPTCRGLGRLL